MAESLVLYDVDPVNPYGRELAAVLSNQREVTLVCSRALSWIPDGVTGRRVLAAPKAMSSMLDVVRRRLFGVVVAILVSWRSRAPIVVVWSRDAWDAFLLALFGRRVIVIDHNPRADRRATGIRGRAEALLRRRAAAVVVHDRSLTDGTQCSVVTHPAYVEWRQRFLPNDPPARSDRVLLLGAIRRDKGAADIAGLIDALPDGTGVTVVGKGPRPHPNVEHIGGDDFVSEERLGEELARGGVVLAPYPGATQSGTVILAITCGLPVLGYAAGALPSLLTDQSLVESGDVAALAATFERYQRQPWPTARVTGNDLTERCARDWLDVLNRVTAQQTRR
ncbi:MAG: hypothetical protein QOC82_2314 [Frankiaceae bacterium]|jgi:glycosyltransferase involved in cell wall biosynthesis|nr:hypothetical protein [Frankiaceae bacterium]